MNLKKLNKALDALRRKYGAKNGEIALRDGHPFIGATPLLPGRMERKIVELKKMTENGTLEGVSTLRFASFAPTDGGLETASPMDGGLETASPMDCGLQRGGGLQSAVGNSPAQRQLSAMLAKELDLAAYLGGSDVVRVMAVRSGAAVDVLAKLASDVNVSVEIGAGLPKGAAPYDRHEIIARRGVACDQTVDTHTPHASIRVTNGDGMAEYTDVDTELFGLTYEEIWTVRAAFAILQGRADAKIWKAAWAKAARAAALALEAADACAPRRIAPRKGPDTNQAIKVAEVR